MTDLQKIRSIFCEALEKETQEERDAYLTQICRDDSRLRAEVDALLRTQAEADKFFKGPLISMEIPQGGLSEGPGTVIGRYKLLEKIGEGGMAVVYMAEQAPSTRSVPFGPARTGVLSDSEGTIRRKVALKIIKLGMDTKQVIARFEAERQALAMMDHPNIAKVLDAGATETGRPYFVMELVKGVSITDYCDANSLSTNERLKLFTEVCNAVQHAHQKGIIHRDIKPSNVMVTHHDGRPVPKVIDFGIAKAINQKLTEKTLFTRYAHIIGTPAYMSPEQAELSDLDIDTRTDIYSLGVLLYELLTGTPPFGEEELRKAGYIEMQRIIREQEPLRPSTKLSTLGGTLTDIAKHRSATPEVLTKAIRGDLDWIVMKALEKDRSRRYEEASSFALDIERHLEHRPVAAHAPSAAYRLRKFVRRNRLRVGAVLAVVAVAGTIIIASLWSWHKVQLAEAKGATHVNALSEARRLVKNGDLAQARDILVTILESEYVGLEARTLFVSIMGRDPDHDVKVKAIMDKHCRERVQYYSGRIQANPADPNNYLWRAQYHDYLHEREKATADMRRWSAILGGSDLQAATPRSIRRVVNGPFGYQLVFSAERPVNEIPLVNIAFGQKGRCNMKPFQMPMLSMSLLGLCLLSGLDTPPARADFTFGEPVNLKSIIPAIDPMYESPYCFSYDGLEMYVVSNRAGGQGDYDLWVLKRDSIDEDWSPPKNMGPAVNTPNADGPASISADGLTLYFQSTRSVGYGQSDIWMMTRVSKSAPWGQVLNMGPKINSSSYDNCPWVSADNLELYFSSWRAGGYGQMDIYVTRRATTDDPWGDPVNLGPVVNSPANEYEPYVSSDGLLLLFNDWPFKDTTRPGGYGGADMWMTRRASLSDPWQTPVNLGPKLNGPGSEGAQRISLDSSTLYFFTNSAATWDNWQAPIIPVCDFNSDGVVDIADVFIMLEHWHTDYSLCDIGPMPWGDGFVDAQDLIVLAEHMANNPADVNDLNNIQ